MWDSAGFVKQHGAFIPSSKLSSDGTAQSEASTVTAGRKIEAVVSKNCNYVYHMLAVSDCGYVNDYGEKYKPLHPAEDLQTLKSYEQYLTVAGGEHQGDLYFLCVVLPASLNDEISVSLYFEALADLFGTGELERNFESYREIYEQSFASVSEVSFESFQVFYSGNEKLKKEIADVTAVMHRNYAVYTDEVWETSFTELSAEAATLNKLFAETDYVRKWEEVLERPYGQDAFLALLCNSMENGPNCINLTVDKDVFYPMKEPSSTVQLINHELGIYLLMDALSDTEAFQGYSYYGLVEALAEYYNTVVSGRHSEWEWGAEYIDFYRQLRHQEPSITAEEMFLRAANHFILAPVE